MSKYLKVKFIMGILLLGFGFMQAQDTLLTEINANRSSVFLRWFPQNHEVWLEGIEAGYQIERFDVSQGTAQRTIMANRVVPKDSIWFKENAAKVEGLLEPIGALLYDTTFQGAAVGNYDPYVMKYNYIGEEVKNYRGVATAVGLGFRDSTVVDGKKYRYVISLNSGGTLIAQGQIEMTVGLDYYVKSPQGFEIEFDVPNGVSLSDMNQTERVVMPSVKAISKAYGDSIVLRWAPNTPKFWAESNKSGYAISRSGGGSYSEELIAIIKPWPQDSLRILTDADSMAFLGAAQIYSTEGAELAEGFVESAELYENRWGFALYAAERSPRAGDVLGLRFVDKNVKRDSFYSYTIESLSTQNYFSKAFVNIFNEATENAPPVGFKLQPGEKNIKLIWNADNGNNFSSYIAEKSEDGKNWTPLTKEPIVFMEEDENPLSQYVVVDSVEYNYKDYYYRLKGMNSFSEWSGFVEQKGQALDLTPPTIPVIKESVFNDTTQQALITWDGGVITDDFDAFIVSMRTNLTTYQPVSEKLPATQTSFTFKREEGFSGEQSHYFIVTAIDKNGNEAPSLENFMAVPDLTPPPPPKTFTGRIDSTGFVELFWEHSEADDVLGYHVYFSNNGEDEFSPMNQEILTINKYSYQFQDVTLNEYLYFVLIAEDERNNRGKPTPVLRIKRPDKVPPLRPDFTNPKAKDGAVHVLWKRSPSEDVVKYYIYKRRFDIEEPWRLIDSTMHVDSVLYLDRDVIVDVPYEYKIQAVDDADNKSEETLPYIGKLPFLPESFVVDNFSALPSKEKSAVLKWDIEIDPNLLPPNLTWKLRIYKSTGSQFPEPLTDVNAETKEFTDWNSLKTNTLYNYSVQVQFSNGQEGKRSPIKSVMLE